MRVDSSTSRVSAMTDEMDSVNDSRVRVTAWRNAVEEAGARLLRRRAGGSFGIGSLVAFAEQVEGHA